MMKPIHINNIQALKIGGSFNLMQEILVVRCFPEDRRQENSLPALTKVREQAGRQGILSLVISQ